MNADKGLNDAIETLIAIGKDAPRVMPVYDHGEQVSQLVIAGDGTSTLQKYDKRPKDITMKATSLDSFIAYMKANTNPERGAEIFVTLGELTPQASQVYGDLAPRQHLIHAIRLFLSHSVAFAQLHRLTHPTTQHEFWEALIGDLSGCINDKLLGQISAMTHEEKVLSEAMIDTSGLVSGGENKSLSITIPGKGGTNDTELGVDWKWSGYIWEEHRDLVQSISLRLVVDKSSQGLRFRFIIKDLAQVINVASESLMGTLRESLDNAPFAIYEGEIQ